MLRKIRLVLAFVAFVLINVLLLDFTGAAHCWLGWMAEIQFLPALLALNVVVIAALVLLTLVFGRIYCSVICPLGIMQDIFSWLHGRHKKHRFSYSPALTWLRWAMVAVLAALIALGMASLASLIAPYSTYGRIATNLLQPLYIWCNNGLAAIAEHYDSYAFYSVDVWMKGMPTFLIAIASLVVIAVLAWRGGRTWCNTVCPVGTVLGLLARFSWMKVRIDTTKCIDCGACSHNCKASCIDFNNHKVDYSRCVMCGDCLEHCKTGALTYCHSVKTDDSKQDAPTDPTGRRVAILAAGLIGAEAALAQTKKKLDGGLAVIEDKKPAKRQTPLTPPGSLSAKNMATRCTACQLCVSKCPNQVLRPSSDLTRLMQPEMSFELGYCRPECNQCSQVCPSDAIRPIGTDDKSAIQIGHAVWIKENCMITKYGAECGNCARHCTTGAITMVPSDPKDDTSPMIPAIDTERCIGCGACEYLCPSRPFSAIYVEGHEVHRTI